MGGREGRGIWYTPSVIEKVCHFRYNDAILTPTVVTSVDSLPLVV